MIGGPLEDQLPVIHVAAECNCRKDGKLSLFRGAVRDGRELLPFLRAAVSTRVQKHARRVIRVDQELVWHIMLLEAKREFQREELVQSLMVVRKVGRMLGCAVHMWEDRGRNWVRNDSQ